MYVLRAISKVISAVLSIIVIAAILVTMGWHKSPVIKPVVYPAKKLYENTVKLVTGRQEETGLYKAIRWVKRQAGPYVQRIAHNLIDFITMTLPKYILLVIIGLVIAKKTKLVSWIT